MSLPLMTNDLAIVGAIDPDATAASTVATSWISAGDFMSYAALILAGTLGTGATIDAKIEQATDAAGAGAKDVTGKAITQLTQGGSDDDKQAIINLDPAELDVANNFSHFRLSITIANATSDIGALIVARAPRNGKPADNDAPTVAEIVA